jgi:DNA-directed RNA polymerase specialized sigma24 family protein
MANKPTQLPIAVLEKMRSLCDNPSNGASLETTYRGFNNRILARLYKRIKDRSIVPDLNQDVWLQFLSAKTPSVQNPVGYLLSITDNVINGYYRKTGNRSRLAKTQTLGSDEMEKLPNTFDPTDQTELNSGNSLEEEVKRMKLEGYTDNEIKRSKDLSSKDFESLVNNLINGINSKPTLKTS